MRKPFIAWRTEHRQSVVPFDLGLDRIFNGGPCVAAWQLADGENCFETLQDVPEEQPEKLLLEGSP